MELVEVKEILKKASVEIDIQGHGKHIALFETDFERVAIELIKKLTTPAVVGQSEQLFAFKEWERDKCRLPWDAEPKEIVEQYLSQ